MDDPPTGTLSAIAAPSPQSIVRKMTAIADFQAWTFRPKCSCIVPMPNPPLRTDKTLRNLRKGEILEFECGQCGRTGLLTVLQLVRLRVALDTRLEDLARRAACRRCGKHGRMNRVRVRPGRD